MNDSAPSRRARGRRLRTWGTVLAIAQVGATVGLLTVLNERPRGLPAERDRAQAQNATTTTAPSRRLGELVTPTLLMRLMTSTKQPRQSQPATTLGTEVTARPKR